MLKAVGHAGFEALRLEWGLQETEAATGPGLAARATSLAAYALKQPELTTPDGILLQTAMVMRAGEIFRSGTVRNLVAKERDAFKKQSGEDIGHAFNAQARPPTASRNESVHNSPLNKSNGAMQTSKKVFIVHGHDEGALQSLARFLEKLKLEVIILKEQPNRGRTIIEKYEACADEVGFAVVLLTPDDIGGPVSAASQAQRARQNVIFELGYFVGKLQRGRVCLLRKGGIEIPSDLFGVVYTEMDASEGWQRALVKELQAAKLDFDPSGFWR